jgi:hypothetical protein
MNERIKVASVEVGNWRDIGPVTEGRHWETGEDETRLPRAEIVIQATTPDGEIYNFIRYMGLYDDINALERAEHLAADIRKRGSINPAYWAFYRVMYGSAAYIRDEADIVARERYDEEHDLTR